MEVILLDDVEPLGEAGDIITVKPGHARNFLFPRGLAVRSSKRNRALSDEKKRVSEARKLREVEKYSHLADQVKKTEITIEVQVGEEEKQTNKKCRHDSYPAMCCSKWKDLTSFLQCANLVRRMVCGTQGSSVSLQCTRPHVV